MGRVKIRTHDPSLESRLDRGPDARTSGPGDRSWLLVECSASWSWIPLGSDEFGLS